MTELHSFFFLVELSPLVKVKNSKKIDLLPTGPGFFLVKVTESEVTVGNIREWETFFSMDDSKVRQMLRSVTQSYNRFMLHSLIKTR